MHKVIFVGLVISAFAIPAGAEEPVNKTSGEISIGGAAASGNTDTNSFNTTLKIKKRQSLWENWASFKFFYGDKDGVASAHRLKLHGKSSYFISDRGYLLAYGSYEDDRFSGYDYRAIFATGYGRQVISNDTILLSVELGPGVRQSAPETGNVITNELIGRFVANFEYRLGEFGASLSEKVTLEGGENDIVTRSVTAITGTLFNGFALKFAVNVKNRSLPAEEKEAVDVLSTISLVYKL